MPRKLFALSNPELTLLPLLCLFQVAVLHAEANPAKASQLPLASLHAALSLQGLDKDNAELQCILANLIYRKYLKVDMIYPAACIVAASFRYKC